MSDFVISQEVYEISANYSKMSNFCQSLTHLKNLDRSSKE